VKLPVVVATLCLMACPAHAAPITITFDMWSWKAVPPTDMSTIYTFIVDNGTDSIYNQTFAMTDVVNIAIDASWDGGSFASSFAPTSVINDQTLISTNANGSALWNFDPISDPGWGYLLADGYRFIFEAGADSTSFHSPVGDFGTIIGGSCSNTPGCSYTLVGAITSVPEPSSLVMSVIGLCLVRGLYHRCGYPKTPRSRLPSLTRVHPLPIDVKG